MHAGLLAPSQHPVARFFIGGLWLSGVLASVLMAAWNLFAVKALAAYVQSNQLPQASWRTALVICIAAGVLGGIACALLLSLQSLSKLEQWTHRVGPLLPVGFVPVLFVYDAWVSRDLAFLGLVSLVGLGWPALFLRAQKAPPLFAFRAARAAWARLPSFPQWPLASVIAGSVAFAAYFTTFSFHNHDSVRTSAFDLGIENNLMWHASQGTLPLFHSTVLGGSMTHLGLHQTWISYLLVPFYWLWPQPKFLLTLQAVAVGAAAIPLFFLVRRSLGAGWGAFLAGAFLLYPPLHGSLMYDFHYQPLSNVLLLGALYFLLMRRDGWASLCVFLTLTLREDMSLTLGVLAAYLVLSGKRPIAGLIVGVVCALHFGILKMTIMPMFLGGYPAYLHQYQGLLPAGENGFGGIIKTVLGNPGFALHNILQYDKLIYVLQIFSPLAFMPLKRPMSALLMLPGFFFTLLATQYPALIQICFQYSTYWVVFAFVAMLHHLELLRAKERRAWLVPVTVCLLAVSHQFGAVLKNDAVRGAWDVHHFEMKVEDIARHDDLYALIALVPADGAIVSSERVVPHVSSRAKTYTLRLEPMDADWLLSSYSDWEPERRNLGPMLHGDFGVVAMGKEFFLAKKGHDKALNAQLLEKLKL